MKKILIWMMIVPMIAFISSCSKEDRVERDLVSGTWKIYLMHNGGWEYTDQEITYEPIKGDKMNSGTATLYENGKLKKESSYRIESKYLYSPGASGHISQHSKLRITLNDSGDNPMYQLRKR